MLSVLAAGTLAASLLVPVSPLAAVTPSDKVTIDVVTVNGSGCPADTADVKMAPDNTAFRIHYSDFRAELGPGADPTDARKNCQVNLLVHVPSGFTYAIAQADYRGSAHLEKGVTGIQKSTYYFTGSSENATASHTFTGPLNGTWSATDETDVAALVFAPCGLERNLNINASLRLDDGASAAPTKTSYMTMKASDGSVSTVYNVTWKRCT